MIVASTVGHSQSGWLDRKFERAMACFAPFEESPHLAVAVSGGADSTVLAMLAASWTKARQGRLSALIVDHGLRPESADEARRVHDRTEALGVTAAVLSWRGDKPHSGIQSAARAARYDLLASWCRSQGVLHLLVGHHADDQAETVAMRAARGSGSVGLGGMSAIVEKPDFRLLRPLLGVTKADLQEWLRQRGVDWLEDPSNRDLRFARARLRCDQTWRKEALRLPDQVARNATVRRKAEAARLQVLARAVTLDPLGFALVDLAPLLAAPVDVAEAALGAVLTCVGGRTYGPASGALQDAWYTLREAPPGKARTLGGCLIQRRSETLVIARETARLPARAPFGPGATCLWDGRFAVHLGIAAPRGAEIGPLGRDRGIALGRTGSGILAPWPALAALPALWVAEKPVSVPIPGSEACGVWPFSAVFRPHRALVSPTFAVA
jgi:tRNA(Ile)-lysidine synthase